MHTDSPETSVAVVADSQPSTSLRRRLIGAGLVGLAGSLVPRLAASAGASAPDDTGPDDTGPDDTGPDDTAAATTSTTEPPKQPNEADVELLGFAQSIELAAAHLYSVALDGGLLGDDATAVMTMVHQAHVSYGQGLNALLGRKASGQAMDGVVQTFEPGFGGDEDSVLAAAYELEQTAVATHSELVGQLQGTDGAELIAAIITTEARAATVLAVLAGETDLDALLLSDAEALVPGEG